MYRMLIRIPTTDSSDYSSWTPVLHSFVGNIRRNHVSILLPSLLQRGQYTVAEEEFCVLCEAMSLSRLVLSVSIFWRLSSAMSVTSNECAVVGCGVLGTSLCRQLIESPEFADWKGA